jgi:hypothetical protein
MVVGKQLACRLRGGERIVALVEHMVDAHEPDRGAACKLPDAGCANMGTRSGIVGGLDVRERRELDGYTLLCKFAFDERAPSTRAFESGTEAIGKSALEPDARCRLAKRRTVRVLAPEFQHLCLAGRERVSVPGAERGERRLDPSALCIHTPLPRAVGQVERHIDFSVNDVEPAVIVQQATVGIDRAEDPHPERDIRQQLGRPWENFPGDARAACKAEREEQNQAYPCHLDLFRRAA